MLTRLLAMLQTGRLSAASFFLRCLPQLLEAPSDLGSDADDAKEEQRCNISLKRKVSTWALVLRKASARCSACLSQ